MLKQLYISRINEARYINSMKLVSANVDEKQVFAIINKDWMKINTDVNADNWLTKECVIKDLIGILSIVNENAINHVMLENI